MRILGFRISWFNSGNRRRSRVTSKSQRLAASLLLKAALENHKTLALIMNKFGQIEMNLDDDIENEIQDLRNKMQKKVAESLLNHHKQEMTYHIDTMIDVILGTGKRSSTHLEGAPQAGTYTAGSGGTPDVHQRRSPGKQLPMQTPNLSAKAQGLKALNQLINLANQGIQMEDIDGSNKTHVAESDRQWPELDEIRHQAYQQQRGQQRDDIAGYPPDTAQQNMFPDTNQLVPPPPDEYEG